MNIYTKNMTPLSIVVSAVLVSYAILSRIGLSALSDIFSILGSLSLVVAIATYFYQKRQDSHFSAIDLIAFFREKVIPEWTEVARMINERDKYYPFSRIKIREKTFIAVREKNVRDFEKQLSAFLDYVEQNNIKVNVRLDYKIIDKQISLLNMLEEAALRIIHLNIEVHPSLESIRWSFVEIVEKNAAALFYVRDVLTSGSVYTNVLKIYFLWSNSTSLDFDLYKNLKTNGLIDEIR